jgi:hypothetical protein
MSDQFNHELELTAFAIDVQNMRDCQKNYFRQIKLAKSTKKPEAFALADQCLKDSKAQEAKVDAALEKLLPQIGGKEAQSDEK